MFQSMLALHLTLATFGSSAFAAGTVTEGSAEGAATTEPATPEAATPTASARERAHLYTAARGGAYFPAYTRGAAAHVGLAIGAEFPHGFAFGLRLQGSPNAAVWGDRLPFAAQPQAEFAYYIDVARNFDIYPSASLGMSIFVDNNAENNSTVLWYHGVGVRARFEDKRGGKWWIAPEFGYEVATMGPTVQASVGYTF